MLWKTLWKMWKSLANTIKVRLQKYKFMSHYEKLFREKKRKKQRFARFAVLFGETLDIAVKIRYTIPYMRIL